MWTDIKRGNKKKKKWIINEKRFPVQIIHQINFNSILMPELFERLHNTYDTGGGRRSHRGRDELMQTLLGPTP